MTGIEVSKVALTRAGSLARRYGVDLNLCQMPGENLRFEKDSFYGVLCVSAYHHMDQERAATEFAPLFYDCMLKCARKLLDTADIVREAMFRQLSL